MRLSLGKVSVALFALSLSVAAHAISPSKEKGSAYFRVVNQTGYSFHVGVQQINRVRVNSAPKEIFHEALDPIGVDSEAFIFSGSAVEVIGRKGTRIRFYNDELFEKPASILFSGTEFALDFEGVYMKKPVFIEINFKFEKDRKKRYFWSIVLHEKEKPDSAEPGV